MTFAGNMPGIDILASDLADTRRISIQVKSKSSGSWHARFPRDAASCSEDPAETSFWAFVDLGGEHPAYFIAPRWWVRNDIWRDHTPPIWTATSKSTGAPAKANITESKSAGSSDGAIAGMFSASSATHHRHDGTAPMHRTPAGVPCLKMKFAATPPGCSHVSKIGRIISRLNRA